MGPHSSAVQWCTTTSMSPDPRIGTELAGYHIESLIGRGGMSVVYLAEQEFPKRKVALKVLSTDLAQDPKFRERFVRESNTAASIEHPNIIPIYGAGDAGGLLYIAMRYIGGADLKKLIQTEGRLSPERTMGIMSQVASALDAAHAKGLVHRDVKPSNILLAPRSEEGSSDHAYLSDFGLTKRVLSDSGITGTGMFVGTLDYAAPEQFEGKSLDKRTDVYSSGCVLYECLTGDLPYARDQDAALMYAHLMSAPPKVTDKRPELPAGIDGVIAKAMAKSPDDRYTSAGQLVAAARAALGVPSGEHILAAPAGEGARRKRGRAPKVGVALVLLVTVIVAFVVFKKGGSPSLAPTNPGSPSSSVPVVTPVSDRLVRIDEATNTVLASIPVGSHPGGVAVGEGSVWVTDSTDGTVSRIDPVTNTITATITVGKGPQGIAVGEGAVWVANRLSNTVSRIDPATNEAVATISVGNAPKAIAVGQGSVWAMSATGCPVAPILTISRVDPATNRFVKALAVGGCALVDGAVGEGSFWAVTDTGELTRFDLDTNAVVKTVHLNKDLAGITLGERAVWVASSGFPGTVFRIDPVTYEVLATIPAGSNGDRNESIGIVTDSGVVWVTDKNNGAVSRIAVAGNDVQPPIDVGKDITGIAVGLGAVWVTVDEP
jgi:YVTN family beta-propeller protein